MSAISAANVKAVQSLWEKLLEYTNDDVFFSKLVVGIMGTILVVIVLRYLDAKKRSTPKLVEKPKPFLNITEEELSKYDGSNPWIPILIAVRGVIYDVTPGKEFYGPGKAYGVFAGRECARALAKVSTDPKDVSGDVSDLNSDQKATLLDWEEKFKAKYKLVGYVVEPLRLTLEQLKEFNGTVPTKPMYLSILGKIYDISNARQFYGPDGMYPFAGCECARALAKMSVEEKDLTDDVADLSLAERESLENWQGKFYVKYRIVGRVVKGNGTADGHKGAKTE